METTNVTLKVSGKALPVRVVNKFWHGAGRNLWQAEVSAIGYPESGVGVTAEKAVADLKAKLLAAK
jgi:hypothetical protein